MLTAPSYCSKIVHIQGLEKIDLEGFDGLYRYLHLLKLFFPTADVVSYAWSIDESDWPDEAYLRRKAKQIIDDLRVVKRSPPPSIQPRDKVLPKAVVFLADYTGATLVKQVLLLALEHPDYQWIAFRALGLGKEASVPSSSCISNFWGTYVPGLYLRELQADDPKYFFESPFFTFDRQWRQYLTRAFHRGGFLGPNIYELVATLCNALCTVEKEFLSVSRGFNCIYLYAGPGADDCALTDPPAGVTAQSTRGRMQEGFQALQRHLSLRNTSLSRISLMATEAILRDNRVLVLSFEFDRWDSRRNSEQALLSSCIRQLLTLNPRLYQTIERIADHLMAQSNVACSQLLTLFCALLSNTEIPVLLIIHWTDQCLQPLRSTLESLTTIPTVPGSVKVLVATTAALKLSDRYHEIYPSKLNILKLIADMVRRELPQIIRHNPDWRNYKDAIHQKLCAEDGTYFQAMQNLGLLKHGYVPSTKNGITRYLSEETPQPDDIFETVVGKLSESRLSMLLLNWVFHALRPLTISELAVALTLTLENQVEDRWDFEMICGELSLTTVQNLILSMGTILKIVASEVMLAHYTIRDYFEAHESLLMPSFHALATICCLRYMSVCSPYISTNSSIKKPDIDTEFLEYAETFWPEHYKLESSRTCAILNSDTEVREFLTSKSDHFKHWMSNYRNPLQWPADIALEEDTLLLAIRFGFRQMVRAINDQGITDPALKAHALVTAAITGNTEIFRDLHRTAPRNLFFGPVLCAAAGYGHTEIVRLLMKQENDASFPSASSSQETNGPLILAASNGHAETVEALLSRGRHIASPEEPARDGEREPRSRTNAVLLATVTGDFKTLSALKRLRPDEFKALARYPDSDGRSPLELCCLSGSPSAFNQLFSVSELTDEELCKLIYLAAEKGNSVIVKRLLDAGASLLHSLTSTSKSPLQAAVQNGHYAVVSKLVSEGERLFESTGTTLWKPALSSSFKACFRNYLDADGPTPTQNDDNPNYDSRIVALLAPHREISPEGDEIAMKSAAFCGELETIIALIYSGGSFTPYITKILVAATIGNRPHIIRFFRFKGLKMPKIDVVGHGKYTNSAVDLAIQRDLGLCLHELLLIDPENPWCPHIYAEHKMPLKVAVQYGKIMSLQVLLHHMPHNWDKSEQAQRILLTALASGELDVIRVLLDHGWPIGHLSSGTSPLDWAIKAAKTTARYDIVELLLDKKADPNFRNIQKEPPLWVAVKWESEPIIKLLMKHNADPSSGHPAFYSALYLAVYKNKSNLVAAMLGLCGDLDHLDEETRDDRCLHLDMALNIPSKFKTTPLFVAIQWRNADILSLLLDAGANPNGGSGVLDSPLNVAMRRAAFDLIKILLQRGANPNIITKESGGPFHILNYYGSNPSEIEELLLSNTEVEIEASTTPGIPIREKQNRVNKEYSLIRNIANLLLRRKANIDAADYTGNTPLLRAILCENMAYAEFLLELEANPNIQDNFLMTAAHYAAFYGSVSLINQLIGAGLDLCALDTLGRTPLYCAGLGAIDDGQDESPTEKFNTIFDALPDEVGKPSAAAALTAVLKAESKELFQKIIQIEELDLNVPDRHGWTALDVATESSALTEEANTLRSMKAIKGSRIKEPTKLSSSDLLSSINVSSRGYRTEAWVEGMIFPLPPESVCAIRADHCVPPNKTTYFEMEVLELASDGVVVIGLCTECSKLTKHIGSRRGAWGYRSSDGLIVTRNEELFRAPPYFRGSTVGVAVDMVARKACFTLDGMWKSPAFDVDGQIYPAISFSWRNRETSKVAVNFGLKHGGVLFTYYPGDDWVDTVLTTEHDRHLGKIEFLDITGWKVRDSRDTYIYEGDGEPGEAGESEWSRGSSETKLRSTN
ncbi:ankyrin repeat-containing domain protein [Xylaria acuta]|nr:ankyrin repeat-containing domain protein [Xylaria acuta]